MPDSPILLKFTFKNKNIQFYTNQKVDNYINSATEKLAKYYEIAHAFYLTEYCLDGFNPNDGQCIFDCGAAHGDTLVFFKTLYPNSPVHSFECLDENIDYVNKNIKANNLSDVFLVKGFLYNKTGNYFLDTKNYSLTDTKSQTTEDVKTISIDDYVAQHNIKDIGLIKFDIEGGELQALYGAKNTILSQKPLLYIPIYHLRSDIYTIPQFLASLNMQADFALKWTEQKVWGVDCVLFVRFK